MTAIERIDELDQRLSNAERSTRRWRMVAITSIAITTGFAAAILGALLMGGSGEVLEVRAIRFIDRNGQRCGFIGVGENNEPSLNFVDNNSEASIALSIMDNEPAIGLFGPYQKSLATMSVDKTGGLLELAGENESKTYAGVFGELNGIVVSDSKGSSRFSAGVPTDGDASVSLSLNDKDNDVQFAIETSDGNAQMTFLRNFVPELRLRGTDRIGGSIALYGSDGKPYFTQQPGQ